MKFKLLSACLISATVILSGCLGGINTTEEGTTAEYEPAPEPYVLKYKVVKEIDDPFAEYSNISASESLNSPQPDTAVNLVTPRITGGENNSLVITGQGTTVIDSVRIRVPTRTMMTAECGERGSPAWNKFRVQVKNLFNTCDYTSGNAALPDPPMLYGVAWRRDSNGELKPPFNWYKIEVDALEDTPWKLVFTPYTDDDIIISEKYTATEPTDIIHLDEKYNKWKFSYTSEDGFISLFKGDAKNDYFNCFTYGLSYRQTLDGHNGTFIFALDPDSKGIDRELIVNMTSSGTWTLEPI